ncbi:iron complex outermembrane receptor protein [Novosphingobium kunmingense]|uniref:Iron complex outermembrane receptor protein n=1 Tax=Novosphingobium kunmingense TaxID=1211806 RepID=A0A2N0H3R1_9SPHN|nr:TonB-dependent receptor [Novosphingobium kunmingense]PKB13573.1 iron complex outermembrane receptor protein [Novosphingobium kunmingense]
MVRLGQLLFCTTALWMTAANPALAQDGSAGTGDTLGNGGEAGAIVVTARRREERLADVPTAASVISASALADRGGATASGELLADQPSVRFNNLNSSITSEISIRASATARATNGDPSVGLYRNGAYIAGGPVGGRNFTRLDFLDIGRVEVLRGTQGALYGRNAVGGAINIISAQPEFAASGWGSVLYGFENDSLQLQTAVNVPLGEGAAIRLSGDLIEQDKGFFYNPVNDVYFDRQKGHALRTQARLKRGPVDAVITAETQRLTTPSIHYQIYIPAGTPGFPGGYIQDQFSYPWNTPPRATQDVDGLQAIFRVDLGSAELTSTSSFRKRRSEYDLDNDAVNPTELARARAAGQIGATTPIDPSAASYVVDITDNFSQDIHVAGTGNRFTWLIGAEILLLDSDFSVTTTRTPTLANPSPGNIAPARLNFESYAAYGSLGYDITESLNLTGELRYTHDTRSISARQYDLATGLPIGGAARIIDGRIEADNLSYNATLAYKLVPNVLAYAKVGSSYRAGGFNTRLSDPRAPRPVEVLFGNENSTSYEVGIKGNPMRRGYFAIAGYYTRLKDLIAQVDDGCALTNAACPVAAVSYLTNAGNAKSWGIEAEFSQSFDIGAGTGRLTLSGSRQGGEVTSGRYDGLDLAQVPDWLASANLNLRQPVADDVLLTGNVLVSGQWGGKQELTATSVDLDDYILVNLRAGLEFGNFSIAAFANNVFDKVYFVAQAPTINRYSQPRVIGVEGRVRF